jgi:hypothetical protein
MPLADVGFNDGMVHFPCYFDTSFGGFWSGGFLYSNMTDTVTSGFTNQYSAKTGAGYNGSSQYAVYQDYGTNNKVGLPPLSLYKPYGCYVTNSTYVYNAIRDGYFNAKKFGGVTGNDPDWFKLTVSGFNNGSVVDTVEFYLADYRSANNANDYIVRDWQWINLQKFILADSLEFKLSSSDTGSFGMNTPAYFCIDNFTLFNIGMGVSESAKSFAAKIYPNPASDNIYIKLEDAEVNNILMLDASGKLLGQYVPNGKTLAINTAYLKPGIYFLQFQHGSSKESVRFIKN